MPREGAPLRGGASRVQPDPLNLIHRNNSPKPVSMRVSGGFASLDLVADDVQKLADALKADPAASVVIAKAIERASSLDAGFKFLMDYYLGGVDAKSTK